MIEREILEEKWWKRVVGGVLKEECWGKSTERRMLEEKCWKKASRQMLKEEC